MLGMDDLPGGHIENLPHSASIFHPSGRKLDGLSSEIVCPHTICRFAADPRAADEASLKAGMLLGLLGASIIVFVLTLNLDTTFC